MHELLIFEVIRTEFSTLFHVFLFVIIESKNQILYNNKTLFLKIKMIFSFLDYRNYSRINDFVEENLF